MRLLKLPFPARRRGPPPAAALSGLRIAVNDELGVLERALGGDCLPEPRRPSAVITSFAGRPHCEEMFQHAAAGCECPQVYRSAYGKPQIKI